VSLLLDQNLSPRLVQALIDVFPGCVHVRDLGLSGADDGAVWDYAKANGYVIVSKDSDFHQMSFVHGPPPKVIWVRLGNAPTVQIETLLRTRAAEIASFIADPTDAFLVLG
jgi:predicted nuclease of predicted toxin-antitoxin system